VGLDLARGLNQLCEPISALIGLGLAGASVASAASQSVTTPPKAATPAVSTPTNVKDTDVKLGSDSDSDTSATSSQQVLFSEKRVQGTSLGKLGRSGLAL
jgi:hypothetical protein